MEAPSQHLPEAIRDEQAKVLRNVRPMSADNMVRGQFLGYRDEPGVAKDSYMADVRGAAALRRLVALGGRAVLRPRRQGAQDDLHRGRSSSSRTRRRSCSSEATPQRGQLRPLPPEPASRHRPRRARQAAGRRHGRRPPSSPSSTRPKQGEDGHASATTSGCSATRWRATPRSSRARTSSRRPGPSSIRSSGRKARCSSTSRDRGARSRPTSSSRCRRLEHAELKPRSHGQHG